MSLIELSKVPNYRKALEIAFPALLLDVLEIKGKTWLTEKVNEAIAEIEEPTSQVPPAGQPELVGPA